MASSFRLYARFGRGALRFGTRCDGWCAVAHPTPGPTASVQLAAGAADTVVVARNADRVGQAGRTGRRNIDRLFLDDDGRGDLLQLWRAGRQEQQGKKGKRAGQSVSPVR